MSPLALLTLSMALVIGLIAGLRLHAFLALLTGATVVAVLAPDVPLAEAGVTVASEFGAVCGRIGVVIALASVVGLALQQSGGALRISQAFLRVTGSRQGDLALWGSGYVLAVPVFFDTVFYLLAPLARAMSRTLDAGNDDPARYPRNVMGVLAGAAATHVFVPPTPGPLAAGAALHVDLGTLVLMGLIVALPASLAGVAYSRWVARAYLPPSEIGVEATGHAPGQPGGAPLDRLPGLAAALTPIVLPVLLISGRTVVLATDLGGRPGAIVLFFGDPNVALFISALFAMWLVRRCAGLDLRGLAVLSEHALASAGSIILITAAGGAYGAMLSRAGIGASLAAAGAASNMPVLWLAYLLAALLKIAQGSSTVAIITAASVLQPAYAASGGQALPHPVYAVLALGGGSLVGSWMNDSGFWIVGRLGMFSDRETLRYWTGIAAVVGTTGFLATLAISALVPLR
jgi:GntP family gluconate:H+ symporter